MSPETVRTFGDDGPMNLYDLLAKPVSFPGERDRRADAREGSEVTSAGARPSRPPHTTVTATIETTDERMINLRHTIAAP